MNAGRPGEKEQERGRVGPAIVKRYRPGVAPDWVKPDDVSDAEPEEIQQVCQGLHAHCPVHELVASTKPSC